MSYSFSDESARFAAPFICKMYFYAPERGTNEIQKKNAGHIGYIGKRQGVDLGEENKAFSQKEFDLSEEIKSWEDDFSHNEGAAGHVKYIDERPRSFGLFSWSDEKPDLKSVQRELLKHKGIVWRSVLSLTEEDAARLGFIERTKWENSLRATVPDVAAKMGIPETNLKWVAAFHKEKGHPHVHLVMWEKKPTRRRGAVHPKLLEDIKRTFAKEIYAEERMQLNQEKTAMRELIRGLGKDELGNIVQVMREMKDIEQQVDLENRFMGLGNVGVTPQLHKDNQLEIVDRIKIIANSLPDHGRIAYQYMPEKVKESVKDVSKWLLQQPAFQDSKRRYYAAVDNLTRQYSFKDNDLEKARGNAEADLEKRLSQIILRAAAELNKMNYLVLSSEITRASIDQSTSGLIENQINDLKVGGKAPILSQKEFHKLNQTLKSIELHPRREHSKSESAELNMNIAKRLWNSVWISLEKERIRSHAQGEIMRQQQMHRLEREAQKDKER